MIAWCLRFILCFLPLPLLAQTVSKDMLKIRESFNRLDQVAIELKYGVSYQGKNQNQQARILKSKGQFYQQFYGSIEQIRNTRYFLVINHQEKKMVIQPASDRNLEGSVNLFQLDSLLQVRKAMVERIPESGGLAGYRVKHDRGLYQKAEIYYDSNRFLPRKILLEGSGGQSKILIEFSYNFQPKIDKKLFDIAKFVVVKENLEVRPTESYKNYQLINGLRK